MTEDIRCQDRVLGSGYSNVWAFHESIACVQGANRLYGYIDKTGQEILHCQHVTGSQFYSGLAAQEDRGQWVHHTSGQVVILVVYDGAFSGGDGELVAVEKYDKWA